MVTIDIILAVALPGLILVLVTGLALQARERKRASRSADEELFRAREERLVADEERRAANTRAAALEDTITRLATAQSEIKGQMGALSKVQADAQARTLKTLEERFDGISGKMNTSLSESAEKTAKSLGELATHLNVIDGARKTIDELSGQVINLQQILDNKQSRGRFGEIRMQDIFTDALPPNAYEFQATLSNGKRPDALILMPGPPGKIAVDSKFPLGPWQSIKQGDAAETSGPAKQLFKQAMRKHIKDIASKYIILDETAESAIMFIPSEAIFAELHAHYQDIIEESYRARVWIVSPSTMMATLSTVRALLRDVEMRKQAGLIQAEVGKIMDDVGRLDERVQGLRTHFTRAEKSIKDIETSAQKVVRKGDKIKNLQLEDISIVPPEAPAPQPRLEP